MYILCREELANLGEDILEELHCLLLSDAKNVVGDAPFAPYIVWAACTSELRVSCECCKHVTWKVNLRNHSDAFAGSIVKDFLYLLLSVIATFAIWSSVIDLAVEKMAYESLLSDGTDLSEEWILLDLKSPALVVSKVPVKGVELVYLHDVEISLDLIDIEEVT